MKKIYFLIIVISSFMLAGCWNYRDVNKMRFVAGVAIDYDKEKNEYISTSEVVRLIEGGQSFGSTLFQSKGLTVFDAVRDTVMKNARRLYWGHAKVIILGPDIVDKNILSILDYASRDSEFRDDIWILVSAEETASKIFEKTFEKRESITSFHIDDILRNEKSISTYHGIPTWRFIKDIYAEGISPTLPMVKVAKKNGEKVAKVGGQAVFKGNKIVGTLNEIETKAYLWVINRIKGGLVTIETSAAGRKVDVTMELFSSKTKLKPKKIGDKIIMMIDIESDFGIAEIAGNVDVIEKSAREILKKDTEKEIKKQVEDVIKKVQKEYESDIFGFSTKIKAKMPEEWRKIESNWDMVFSGMKTEINVKVNINGSALASKPIKVED
ncbi:MAG: Ger(x)C family spore germination protein [Maledivibacter sp.]|jgi:spore germination protein KC|nr:Ger(x)C family spore germination protein [Maledivibacter sp.]